MNRIKTGEETKTNYAMVSDRWFGLEALHWQGESVADFVGAYHEKVINGLDGSPIYFTYTQNGLHLLAIATPLGPKKKEFQEAMNSVRGDAQEYDFLKELSAYQHTDQPDGTYFALDLYVEDMLHSNVDAIPIDGFVIGTSESLSNPQQAGLDELLKKYNRTLGDLHALKNKSWNVYLFDAHAGAPNLPSITVKQKGQAHYLSNHWS